MALRIQHQSAAARNTCRVCEPLGASLAFLGLRSCVPLIHGSQGCSTYIRRYMIGHFREPVDIASTNFSEDSAIYGGKKNFLLGIANLMRQYHPDMIGVSTSCLAETMGEDLNILAHETRAYLESLKDLRDIPVPQLIMVRTASYRGSHRDGYIAAQRSIVEQCVRDAEHKKAQHLTFLTPFCSPADIRHFKELIAAYGLTADFIPDYSQTLDDGQWSEWQKLPSGGTSLQALREAARASWALDFSITQAESAGTWLQDYRGVQTHHLELPIGIEACDRFFKALGEISGADMPEHIRAERERLLDSYVDAHKFAFGRRVLVYGEEELACAIAGLAREIGMDVVLCATGGSPEVLQKGLERDVRTRDLRAMGMADFEDLRQIARDARVDLLIGNSKGYVLSRELNIPLVRVGFPIHDRIGGQRLLSVGYRGTQNLFDRIINALIEREQEMNPYGYKTY